MDKTVEITQTVENVVISGLGSTNCIFYTINSHIDFHKGSFSGCWGLGMIILFRC